MPIKVGNETKWVCRCGLSSSHRSFDDSHKMTADEEADKIYDTIYEVLELGINRFSC
jgi:CDGSH iron-sulfur domain-containing protein 3